MGVSVSPGYDMLTALFTATSTVCLLVIAWRLIARRPSLDDRKPFSGRLESVIELAIERNRYTVEIIPAASLQRTVRITPGSLQTAAQKISELHRAGHALSIDLTELEPTEAIRLVDYCDGLASASDSWMFRVAARVLVLMPATQ